MSRNVKVVIMVWLLMWLGFNFWENGFGWPIKKPLIVSTNSFLFENIDWLGFDDYPVRATNREVWPNEEIIDDLNIIATKESRTPKMLMLVNIEEVNDNNLNLNGLMKFNQRWMVVPLNLGYEYDDWQKTEEIIGKYEYFLVPEKIYEAAPFYTVNLKSFNFIKNWIWDNIEKFEIVKEYQLPNEKKIFLIKRI